MVKDEVVVDERHNNLTASSIRIRPELRATQVDEARDMVPAVMLYFTEKYDLGATTLSEEFHKVNLLQALKFILKSDARIIEVPEPLWVRFLPKNIAILAAWKLSGWVKGGSRLAVTYAIENNDLTNILAPKMKIPRIGLCFAGRFLGFLMSVLIDRIAFGSSGSMALYNSLGGGVRFIPQRLFEEIPERSGNIREMPTRRVIFVGELDDRKGILDVMKAWPDVESSLPDDTLTIVGAGPHSEKVREWCSQRPTNRLFVGFLSHEDVKKCLQDGGVLVAPSRRLGRWREQIGLPIAEALSHGLTVVTTDETGLVDWLREQGHTVISETRVSKELSTALVNALQNPLLPSSVRSSLPPVSGRIQADKWLHTL